MADVRILKNKALKSQNQKYVVDPEDDEGGSGSGAIKPKGGEGFYTNLKEETTAMENKRRLLEQSGHRQYGSVNARDRKDNPNIGNEATLTNDIKQHPLLQSQRFDGIDPSVTPLPDNPDALAQFENERSEQKKQQELRLGLELTNSKRFDSTPKFTR